MADIRQAISKCKSNFDVVADGEKLLQVNCCEGRFVVESHCNGKLVSLLQGSDIMLYHGKVVYIGNDFATLDNKDIETKIYFEDLSNLLD